MNATVTPVQGVSPIRHREAMEIAAAEYQRFLDVLRGLDPRDWSRPTDCERWSVKDIVSHVTGTGTTTLSMREQIRQVREGKKVARELGLGNFDGQNELQVRERAHVTPAEILQTAEETLPRVLRARSRLPAPVRAIRLKMPILGWASLGYLYDIILTRDIWMHRVDISRAAARELVLTREHDGRLVSNVVADWAGRHGQPFRLTLEGPAGGTLTQGDGGEEHRLDAVEFCRIMSGRGRGEGLLATPVPF